MKKLLLLLSCLLTAVLFSGCGIQHPDTVSYVLEAEPSRLNPAMTMALVESNVELQIFEGLTRLDDDDDVPAGPRRKLDIHWMARRIPSTCGRASNGAT